jgi:hypothetical protein
MIHRIARYGTKPIPPVRETKTEIYFRPIVPSANAWVISIFGKPRADEAIAIAGFWFWPAEPGAGDFAFQ